MIKDVMKLTGTITCQKSIKNPRELIAVITCIAVDANGIEIKETEVIYDYFIR